MLNRIRMVFGRTLKAPAYADPPSGTFEVLGNRCVGRIDDPFNLPSQPILVTATRLKVVIRTWAANKQKTGYLFSFDFDHLITIDSIATEKIELYCENIFGLGSKLKLDGASQLTLIRDRMGKPRDVLFSLDFTIGGNVSPFLDEGWSGPEPSFRWSNGKTASLTVPAKISEKTRYEMTINCLPYLAPPTITSQSFLMYVNGYPLTFKMGAKDIGFLAKTFEPGDIAESDVVKLQFEFYDCAKPSERGQSKDNRLLAFAFKQLTFARLLPIDNNA